MTWASPQYALADWWGLFEADPVVLGVVVVALVGFAGVYVGRKFFRSRRGKD